AQAKLLRLLVDDLGWGELVTVSTVHRFQGGEADAVIVDLTTAQPHDPLGPLLGGDTWAAAGRLLNVATSRARGKLVVVGDIAHIRRVAKGHDALRSVLHTLSEVAKGGAISPKYLVQGLSSPEIGGRVSLVPSASVEPLMEHSVDQAREVFVNM